MDSDRASNRDDRQDTGDQILLAPPRDLALILISMLVLFALMSVTFLVLRPPRLSLFSAGLAAVVAGVFVQLIRMVPVLSASYTLDRRGIQIRRKWGSERFWEWDRFRSALVLEEWVILTTLEGKRIRIRLSLYDKPKQQQVRALLTERFEP